MDSTQLRCLYVVTDLVLPLLVGYYLKQYGWLSSAMCNRLMRFNVIIIYTILAWLGCWVLPMDWNLAWFPLLGLAVSFIPAWIVKKTILPKYTDELEKGSYLSSILMSNIGTLGGLCAFIIFGGKGFVYAQIIGIVQTALLVIYCFPLAQRYYDRAKGRKVTSCSFVGRLTQFITWNQLSLLGMAVGIGLQLGGIARPALLGGVFDALIHIGAWIAFIPVGYLMDFKRAKPYYHKLWDMVLIKQIVTPLLLYMIGVLLFDDKELRAILLILCSSPTAINAVIVSKLYNLNVDLTMASFIMTTLLYILVFYPLLYLYILLDLPL